jgi:hypothetical protein
MPVHLQRRSGIELRYGRQASPPGLTARINPTIHDPLDGYVMIITLAFA